MRLKSVFMFILLVFISNAALGVQKGGIQYAIPIDYSLINESELKGEAENLFQQYQNTNDETKQKILLNKLLSDYSILGELDKENPLYFARLGIIFDKLGYDRWAKSNFCRSSNLDGSYPYSFYNYGNFFYERSEFRRALKEYKKAYDNGYSSNYDTVYKMGKIYEKLGDYENAVEYYRKAYTIKSSPELQQKIDMLNNLAQNSLYSKSLKQRNKR